MVAFSGPSPHGWNLPFPNYISSHIFTIKFINLIITIMKIKINQL